MKVRKFAVVFYILALCMLLPLASQAVTPMTAQFVSPDYAEPWVEGADSGVQNLSIQIDYTAGEKLNIIVTDNRNGTVWESNPIFTSGDKATITEERSKLLKCQLQIKYTYDPNGNSKNLEDIGYMSTSSTEGTFNSYSDSVVKDQVEFTVMYSDGTSVKVDGTDTMLTTPAPAGTTIIGYRVDYGLGERKPSLFPKMLSDERMQYYLSLLVGETDEETEKLRTNFLKKYEEISIENEESKIERELKRIKDTNERAKKEKELRQDLEDLIADYPLLETTTLWRIYSDSISTRFKVNQMVTIWEQVSYTRELMEMDYAEINYTDTSSGTGFVIPVEYVIEGNTLRVTILTDEIDYPPEVALTRIDLLPSFGAADDTCEDGYALVPDGSGAVIGFNDEDQRVTGYQVAILNRQKDEALSRNNTTDIRDIPYYENSILPVYGLKKDNAAFLCIMEKGYELANICANIADQFTKFNYCYSSYFPITVDAIYYTSGSSSGIKMFPKIQVQEIKEVLNSKTKEVEEETSISKYARMPATNLQQRYCFLYEDEASYSGMAQYYRTYLMNTYDLDKLTPEENVAFYADIYGVMDKKISFAGFPINIKYSLTDFEQAEQIVSDITEIAGVKNISLRYIGMVNGGLVQTYAGKFKVCGAIGGKSGYKNFLEAMSVLGVDVYPDIDMTHIYKDKMFDGFSPTNDTVMTLGKTQAIISDLNVSTGIKDSKNDVDYYHPRWMLSPRLYDKVFDNMLTELDEYDNMNVAMSSLGSTLTADYDEDCVIDRTQTARLVSSELKKYKDAGYNVIVEKGFINTIPYVSTILNIPMTSSEFIVEDYEVPFVQMVLHGLVEYAGEPLNVTQNTQYTIMKSLEYGGSVYARYMYEDDSVFQNTYFVNYYSMNYTNWLDETKAIYSAVNNAIADCQDQFIVNHERLATNVYRSTYENGKQVICNYGTSDYVDTVTGQTVLSNNYIVIEGAK